MSIKNIDNDDNKQEFVPQQPKMHPSQALKDKYEKLNRKKEKKSHFILSLVLVVFTVFMVVRALGLQMVSVDGTSMYPELHNNQRIVTINPFWNSDENFKRGDVIVFNAYGIDPEQSNHVKYIKRIIGVPGDKISFNGKHVYVNGKPEDEVLDMKVPHEKNSGLQPTVVGDNHVVNHWTLSKLSHRKSPLGGYAWNSYSVKDVTVPHGCYFVMGDHRKISNDSRYWGFVPADKITGKSLLSYKN